MHIIFWQNIISIHQVAFLSALGKDNDVVLVAQEELDSQRTCEGWQLPDTCELKIITAPTNAEIVCLLDENKEAIHAFSGIDAYSSVYTAFKIATSRNYKVINLLEPYEWEGIKGLLRRIKYVSHQIRFGRKMDAILATGQLGVDSYLKAGFKKEKVFQWGYFTAVKKVDKKIKLQETESSKAKLLYVARLDKNKNSLLLLYTIKPLMGEVDKLTLVGDGELRALVETKVAEMPNACYLGRQTNERVHELMREHDILILPSNYDGWGAVVNEALQNGMRVVVSQNCGANVLVDGKQRGEVFFFKEGKHSLTEVLKHWIAKGSLSTDDRHKIALWAENNICGKAAAAYFVELMNYIYGEQKGTRPVAPWLK